MRSAPSFLKGDENFDVAFSGAAAAAVYNAERVWMLERLMVLGLEGLRLGYEKVKGIRF
jgi:hypothetical protein